MKETLMALKKEIILRLIKELGEDILKGGNK